MRVFDIQLVDQNHVYVLVISRDLLFILCNIPNAIFITFEGSVVSV